MDTDRVISVLREQGLLSEGSVKHTPLKGGVSSDIVYFSDGSNSYVVKQAVPKLRVEDDWYADIKRNSIEPDFIRFIQKHLPEAVAELLYIDNDHHLFVMEYLGADFQNWKEQMLEGRFDAATATKAAEILSEIHLRSWYNERLKQQFNNAENFHSLRTEPYLITTGQRHADLEHIFIEEAERLKQHQEALVHGDFSPKNIMVRETRLVILDHEVAWFGDPAFDLAFFLNHLYLKMLVHYRRQREIQDLTTVVWSTYFSRVGEVKRERLEARVGRLLLMMMLARVDGKSPVEYLERNEKEFIRAFVHNQLPGRTFGQVEINSCWKSELKGWTFED